MSLNKEKQVLLNIIEIYKDMPCLWNKGHHQYKNKTAREECYKVLLNMYKSFDENASIKTIKKKIDNMRTSFIREAKKVASSKHTGAGTEEIYVPSLWYYDAFSFYGSATEPCRTARDTNDTIENENSSPSSDEEISRAGSSSAPTHATQKKKKTLLQKQEQLLDNASNLMSMKEEEWEVLGKSIGLQMRELKKTELTIALKLISDIIFYAKIGRLTEDASINLSATSYPSPGPSSMSASSYQNNSRRRFSYYQSPQPSPQYHTQNISQPSPQNHIQTPQPSPQYHIQTPQPSPRQHIQSPQSSPQQHIQTPQPSPQQHIQSPQPLPQQHIQSPQPLPQQHIQSPQPSPQQHIQSPQPSPQYQISQPSPQQHIHTDQPSPQQHIIPTPQSSLSMPQISDPLPQHRYLTTQTLPQHQLQTFEPPVLHIPDPLQYQLQSPSQHDVLENLQFNQPDNSLQPSSHKVDITEYLIFRPSK